MGNIRGLSGIFFFFLIIVILIPIKIRQNKMFTVLTLLTLWILNVFNDIYKHRQIY